MLPSFNEEKMLEDEADEVPDKAFEVDGNLDKVTVIVTTYGTTVAEDRRSATKDDVNAEGTSPNFSPDS